MNSDEFRKTIDAAVSSFSKERQAALKDLNEVDKLRGKIPELEQRISDNEREISELRPAISQGVSSGKDASRQIQRCAELKATNEVLIDLVSDLRDEKIPAAEQAARLALDEYQGKIAQAIHVVRDEHQRRFAGLVKTMALDVISWNEALASFSKDSGALISGKYNSPIHGTKTALNFPNINAGDNPERVLTLIERGEL